MKARLKEVSQLCEVTLGAVLALVLELGVISNLLHFIRPVNQSQKRTRNPELKCDEIVGLIAHVVLLPVQMLSMGSII